MTGFERFHGEKPTAGGGAILFNELGCANCHVQGVSGILPRQGPVLADLVSRVEADWVKGFLADPQQAKPGTMMPAMFSGLAPEERATQVEAVTHYLMSLKPVGKPPKRVTWPYANAERGSAQFHEMGCVACHQPRDDYKPAAGAAAAEDYSVRPVPLPDLASKYSLVSLATFLQTPSAARPDGRMPHFQLESQDALDIAAYLTGFRPSDPRAAEGLAGFKVDTAMVKQGGEIVTRLNCASCHTLTDQDQPVEIALPTSVKSREAGCLSKAPASGRPNYELNAIQQSSLLAYLQQGRQKKWGDREVARMNLQALNCLACHERDDVGGPDVARTRYFVGDEALGDSGRLPPPLTGIGRKLKPEWMEKVFKGDGRVRPYLKTRMPSYAAHAKALTALLQRVDARPDLTDLSKGGETVAGRKLLGIQGGMNCVTCHVWGDKPSLGIQALDISGLDERLKPKWFRDYLLNPAGYRPGTLMPPLWPGGVSMVKDVCGGDTEKQMASIWKFIAEGEGLPGGYPEIVPGAFELKPTDRPILQRTFMNGVGARAIVVGFPGGVNLAYNAESGGPAKLWRGRFFDAYSTWFVRAAPFEDPLGEDVLDWPAANAEGPPVRFGGYRLDGAGNPTFILRRSGKEIMDHYEGVGSGLKRTLVGEVDRVDHPAGAEVEEAGHQTFIYSWK